MNILLTLNKTYERLAERGDVPPYGYSLERIGFLISVDEKGAPVSVTDLRDGEGKKKRPRMMAVPQPVKRTAGVIPNFLWDKTSYVLGVTAGTGKRLSQEHAAFVQTHMKALVDTEDVGLLALRYFLECWTPKDFSHLGWPEDMKDQNVVFALESDRRNNICIHDRPAAQKIWAEMKSKSKGNESICLVTGEKAQVARLHPAIKGIRGGQSSGGSLVSFNLDAFESYSHDQGDNAPISEHVAFGYTAVLNKFLGRRLITA